MGIVLLEGVMEPELRWLLLRLLRYRIIYLEFLNG